MKKLFAIFLLTSLAACGAKQEEITPAHTISCAVVTILSVDADANLTYLEVDDGLDPHARWARSGKWGNVGDRFRYCD